MQISSIEDFSDFIEAGIEAGCFVCYHTDDFCSFNQTYFHFMALDSAIYKASFQNDLIYIFNDALKTLFNQVNFMADSNPQIASSMRTLTLLNTQAESIREELVVLRKDKEIAARKLIKLQSELLNTTNELTRARNELDSINKKLAAVKENSFKENSFNEKIPEEKIEKERILKENKLKETNAKEEQQDNQPKEGSEILALGSQLKKANEQLVVAALNAETIAEATVNNLEEMERTSQRDPLTGTPNRLLMLDRLESAIAIARRRGTRVAVLFLDVDDFKMINDSLGHSVGDEVIKYISRQLESVVRESDTVSRHGGDEFLVLLADVMEPADVECIAKKILAAIAAPAHILEHDITLSGSLGIAIYPDDARQANALIDLADAAMYSAKRRQHGSFEFYRN